MGDVKHRNSQLETVLCETDTGYREITEIAVMKEEKDFRRGGKPPQYLKCKSLKELKTLNRR